MTTTGTTMSTPELQEPGARGELLIYF